MNGRVDGEPNSRGARWTLLTLNGRHFSYLAEEEGPGAAGAKALR